MALSMTRPQKHPSSGYYWFRKRVPDDLRSLIGKREEHFSLGTRDPSEAKRLHALKLAEVEERWANLRLGQRPLSPDDVARLASEIGEALRRRLEADPYQPLRWDLEVGARLWTSSDTHDVYTDITQALSPADRERLKQQKICYALVDEHVIGRGILDRYDSILRETQELIRVVEQEMQDRQAALLTTRGTEVKDLYDRLNRGANVVFDHMEPGTDSMKLHATSFGTPMSAAANLSECQLNCLGIRRIDGSTTDFSVKPCLDGKAPSAFAETLRAMRTEVVEDIKQMKWEFFRASTHPDGKAPCALTGRLLSLEEAMIDHAPPKTFKALAERFLHEIRIVPSEALLTPAKDNQYTPHLADRDLAEKWREFYRANAAPRIVAR